MKFYIAAYVREKTRVKEIFRVLRKAGHEITVDWTNGRVISIQNRDKDPKQIQGIAVRDMNGARNCDVFIILSTPVNGRAKYVELGAAISSFLEKGRPLVYVLGEKTDQSVFYYHPAVNRVRSLEEIINDTDAKKDGF
ncbi:MAG: hypothetical protein Q8O74_05265 [bacterium]|nr:hypothetical protein [bacterium]